MIIPTIGRVVWFYPTKNYSDEHAPGQPYDQPWKADVTYVHGDRLVNLRASTPSGNNAYGVAHVTLVQDCDDPPTGLYCTWMPYQTGVAKGDIDPTLNKGRRYPSQK